METTFDKIVRKTGKKPVECKCEICKDQCRHQSCIGSPEDMIRIMEAGYKDRLKLTLWRPPTFSGLIPEPISILAPIYDTTRRSCTFFVDGLCQLHASGLKPTEGRLSHHSTQVAPKAQKLIAWHVVKEWTLKSQHTIEAFTKFNTNE